MAIIINKAVNVFQTYERRGPGGPVIPCLNWILYSGIWNDSKVWIDTCVWNDS